MAEEFQVRRPVDSLTFRLRSGAFRPRAFPFAIGPRRLADTLVEFASGGSWILRDLDANLTIEAGPGQVLVVPADRSHDLRMVHATSMHTRWALIALEDEIGRDLFLRLPHALLIRGQASVRAARLIKQLQDAENITGLAARIEFQRHGFELASLIFQACTATIESPSGHGRERIEDVLRYVRDHLHEPITREDLARRAFLSPTRFHYVFRQATGSAPMKYLMEQRIKRARQLLLSTTLSCKEIGRQCGFVSPMHFSRTFTHSTGIAPMAYRAQTR